MRAGVAPRLLHRALSVGEVAKRWVLVTSVSGEPEVYERNKAALLREVRGFDV